MTMRRRMRRRMRRSGLHAGGSIVLISVGEKQRGVENSGEGKAYHKTPPQNQFWTPPPMIAISTATYRGAKCPTLKTAEKQLKRVPSGSR